MTLQKLLKDVQKNKRFANDNIHDLMVKHNVKVDDLSDNVQSAVANLLDALMIDWRRDPNSAETPKRLAKMYLKETLCGRYEPAPRITVFPAKENLDQMMFIEGLRVESLCSHHHQNIRGTATIGVLYGKKGKLLGLSKYQRILSWFCRRPQIQELLTTNVGDYLYDLVKPEGLGITITSEHQCLSCRGVEVQGSVTTTQKLYGVILDTPSVRAEYMQRVNSYGK